MSPALWGSVTLGPGGGKRSSSQSSRILRAEGFLVPLVALPCHQLCRRPIASREVELCHQRHRVERVHMVAAERPPPCHDLLFDLDSGSGRQPHSL